jgi:hypothetical protein
MRTDADDLACVRDPAIELLLSHAATLTDEWCSRPTVRKVDRDATLLVCGVRERSPLGDVGGLTTRQPLRPWPPYRNCPRANYAPRVTAPERHPVRVRPFARARLVADARIGHLSLEVQVS